MLQAQVLIFLVLLGVFLAVMPFVAIWKIWHTLERIEKHNEEIRKILEMLIVYIKVNKVKADF